MIYDIVGYIALIINLYSMYTKGEFKLRMFSLIANSIYIIYGALIGALPIVIGCSIAVFLHAKRMRNLKLEGHANNQ